MPAGEVLHFSSFFPFLLSSAALEIGNESQISCTYFQTRQSFPIYVLLNISSVTWNVNSYYVEKEDLWALRFWKKMLITGWLICLSLVEFFRALDILISFVNLWKHLFLCFLYLLPSQVIPSSQRKEHL